MRKDTASRGKFLERWKSILLGLRHGQTLEAIAAELEISRKTVEREWILPNLCSACLTPAERKERKRFS